MLYRNAVEIGEFPVESEEKYEKKMEIMTSLMGLSVIQPEKVLETFNRIKTKSERMFPNRFKLFFQYFETEWILKRGVSSLSCFDNIDCTTDAELRYHRSHDKSNQPAWEYLGKTLN